MFRTIDCTAVDADSATVVPGRVSIRSSAECSNIEHDEHVARHFVPIVEMNARFAAGIVATIIVGLAVDASGTAWSQPCVDMAAWTMFCALLAMSPRPDRIAYFFCLGFATAGEIFLALVWGVYEYRLGNLPLFVPPGHVLLYALGRWISERTSFAASGFFRLLVLVVAAVLAAAGIDQLSAALAILFVLCMRFGPAPRLYSVMFVLALAMEFLGTGLGNWSWQAQAPGLAWSTLNPPFAAGAFYCALDLLVGRAMSRSRNETNGTVRAH